MAASQINSQANTFKSNIDGLTVTGKAHSLSAWFVLALRLMMGYAFLYSAVLNRGTASGWGL